MILITGATGFIGQQVVKEFLKLYPEKEVRALIRNPKNIQISAKIEFLKGNLENPETLLRALKNVKVIIHLAQKTIDNNNNGFYKTNILGTQNLCKAAIQSQVRKFIFLSTTGVYGHNSHQNADEETPCNPDTAYSRSKYESEKIILDHHKNQHFQAIILRSRFVYGEGDLYVIPRFIKWIKKYPVFLDGGRAKISVISVNDLAKVICLLTIANVPVEPNPIYHITDGKPLEVKEIINTICHLYDLKFPRYSLSSALILSFARIKELITSTNPEITSSTLSSIRLKMVTRNNYFSNEKLNRLLGIFEFESFRERMEKVRTYYSGFINNS